MKLLLAHHYWAQGKNATWFPARFPLPELESSIKDNYVRLQAERPAWEMYGKTCVFFHYRPEKDVFGRDIVGISFAFLPKCSAPERSAQVVLPLLSRCRQDQTELDVALPWEMFRPGKGNLANANKGKVLGAVCSVLLVAGAAFFAIKNLFTPASNESPVAIVAPQQGEQETKKSIENLEKENRAENLHAKNALLANKSEKQSPSTVGDTQKAGDNLKPLPQGALDTSLKRPALCDSVELLEKLAKCPHAYAIAYCEGKTSMSFEDWRKGEGEKQCGFWSQNAIAKDIKAYLKYSPQEIKRSPDEDKMLKEVFQIK